MGIFRITIRKISSHTMRGSLALALPRDLRDELAACQDPVVGGVLGDLEGCPGSVVVDVSPACNAHREPGGRRIELLVSALIHADPTRASPWIHPGGCDGVPASVLTEKTEPRIGETPVPEDPGGDAAPETALERHTRRIAAEQPRVTATFYGQAAGHTS